MRKTEIILAALAVLGFIMMMMLWPGGAFLLIVSLGLLSILYYPLGFFIFSGIRLRRLFKRDSYKETTVLRILWSLGVGQVLAALCLGLLFRMNDYPGSGPMLTIGLLTSAIVLPLAVFRYSKTKSAFFKRVIIRMTIWGVLGLIFLPISSLSIQKLQYRNHPQYIEMLNELDENPEDESLRKRAEQERWRITMPPEHLERLQQREQDEAQHKDELND